MRELVRQVEAMAQAHAPVLIVGENGTGKGRIARHIHALSPRAGNPFASINCVTGSATELEVDLFGDADGNAGILQSVSGGTVFLDEISDLPDGLQARLLAVVGIEADLDVAAAEPVRVIAASSKDLVGEVTAGRFREDLYYRLSVTPLYLPPLRARSREDLIELIDATFNMLSANMANAPRTLAEEVTDCLIAYPWPGNIRELRNALERAIMVARGQSVLQRAHLPAELHDLHGSDALHTPRTLMDVERAHIHRALRAHKLNRTHAARELGISRATLIKKIKEYGLVHRNPSHA
jgi:transcriptional regulator with PAS, ATPase and Fis domain